MHSKRDLGFSASHVSGRACWAGVLESALSFSSTSNGVSGADVANAGTWMCMKPAQNTLNHATQSRVFWNPALLYFATGFIASEGLLRTH